MFKVVNITTQRSLEDKQKMEKNTCSNRLITDVNGQKMSIEGVSKYTTCDDVIEMVFYNRRIEVDSYAVFESSSGVERMLYGKESILKVVRSWGADRDSFALLIRKVDNVKTKMGTLSQARRKLRKIRSQNMNVSSSKQDNCTIEENLNMAGDKLGALDKEIQTTNPANEKYTKLGLLKRFLSDVMLQKKKTSKSGSKSRLTRRTPGDGCSGSPVNLQFQPSESALFGSNTSNLNAAFVEGDDTTDSDSDIDIDNTTLNMMNQTISTSENESAFEDDSICELERNIDEMSDIDSEDLSDFDCTDIEGPFCDTETTVIKCKKIIDIFRKTEIVGAELETEDDSLQSFLNTAVYTSDSDEGMGSLDSDTD